MQDNKCSWLIVQALQKATPAQKSILEASSPILISSIYLCIYLPYIPVFIYFVYHCTNSLQREGTRRVEAFVLIFLE
jgi:hypothetical protein